MGIRSRAEIKWIEVWIDSPSGGGYVLLLRATADGVFEVVDPQEKGRVIKVFQSYQEATQWLNEDEYDLIEGRWEPEAG